MFVRKSNERHINAVPLDMFNWNKDKKSLSAELSDLEVYSDWFCQPLYNDAADVGIAIYSETTDVTHRFYLDDTITRWEDIMEWVFKPIDQNCPVKVVTIFND